MLEPDDPMSLGSGYLLIGRKEGETAVCGQRDHGPALSCILHGPLVRLMHDKPVPLGDQFAQSGVAERSMRRVLAPPVPARLEFFAHAGRRRLMNPLAAHLWSETGADQGVVGVIVGGGEQVL